MRKVKERNIGVIVEQEEWKKHEMLDDCQEGLVKARKQPSMKDWKAMELEKGSKGMEQGKELLLGDFQEEGRGGDQKALTRGDVRELVERWLSLKRLQGLGFAFPMGEKKRSGKRGK